MHKVRGNYSSCTCRSSENICSSSGGSHEKGKTGPSQMKVYLKSLEHKFWTWNFAWIALYLSFTFQHDDFYFFIVVVMHNIVMSHQIWYTSWNKRVTSCLISKPWSHNFQGVCHSVTLTFTFKSILRQKEELWKFKYFTTQKYNLQKNPLKITKMLQHIITL
jgi:hypothetical protein